MCTLPLDQIIPVTDVLPKICLLFERAEDSTSSGVR